MNATKFDHLYNSNFFLKHAQSDSIERKSKQSNMLQSVEQVNSV